MEAKHQHQYQHQHLPPLCASGAFEEDPPAQQKQISFASSRLSGLGAYATAGNPRLGSVEHAALAAVVGELDAELRVEVSARIDRVAMELQKDFTRRLDEMQSRMDKLIEDSDPVRKLDARLSRLEDARLDLRLGALESAAHHSAVFVPPPSKLDTSVASIQFSSQPPTSKLDASPGSLQFSSQPLQLPISPRCVGPSAMSYLDSHTPLKPPSPDIPRISEDLSHLDTPLSLPEVTVREREQDTDSVATISHQRQAPPPLMDLDLTTRVEEMAKVARELLAGEAKSSLDGSMNLMATSDTVAMTEASSLINGTSSSSSGCTSAEAEDKSSSVGGDAFANMMATAMANVTAASAAYPETSLLHPQHEVPSDDLKTIAAAAAAAAAASYGQGGGLGGAGGAALDWQPMISDELKSRLEGLVESVKKTLGETRAQRNMRSAMFPSCAPMVEQGGGSLSATVQPVGLSPLRASRITQVAGGSLSASVVAPQPIQVHAARSCSPVRPSASLVIPQAKPCVGLARTSSSAVIGQPVPSGNARVAEVHIGPAVLRSVSITRHRLQSPTRATSPIRGSAVIPSASPSTSPPPSSASADFGRQRSPSPPRRVFLVPAPGAAP